MYIFVLSVPTTSVAIRGDTLSLFYFERVKLENNIFHGFIKKKIASFYSVK
jgi:hypothetical protein